MPKAFQTNVEIVDLYQISGFYPTQPIFEFDAQPLSFSVCEIIPDEIENCEFLKLDFRIQNCEKKSRENTMAPQNFNHFDLTRKIWWTKFKGQVNFLKLRN